MSVKEHYDNHLSHFYAWYAGDFESAKENFISFCRDHSFLPGGNKIAIDLGAGHGIQTMALSELGYQVRAIDFSRLLLDDLAARKKDYPVEIFCDDIRNVSSYDDPSPELIICCGDTLPHLPSTDAIKKLINDSYKILSANGRLLLSFRDYSEPLQDANRFIPVKSDRDRILTCILEYEEERLKVTDLLHEYKNGRWIQKVSSYFKTRITVELVMEYLKASEFNILFSEMSDGMTHTAAQK